MINQNIKEENHAWFDECLIYSKDATMFTYELYESYQTYVAPKIPLKKKTFVTNFKKTFEKGIDDNIIKFYYEKQNSVVRGVQVTNFKKNKI